MKPRLSLSSVPWAGKVITMIFGMKRVDKNQNIMGFPRDIFVRRNANYAFS